MERSNTLDPHRVVERLNGKERKLNDLPKAPFVLSRSKRFLLASVIATIAIATASSHAQNRNERSWIYFESKESANGRRPELILNPSSKRPVHLPIRADAPLISYLSTRSFGRLTQLPVGVMDQNRSILRFDIPALLKGASIDKAILVLDMKLSKRPPTRPIELAFHEVTSPWKEGTVSWSTQPSFKEEPFLRQKIASKSQVLRFDVTSLTKDWLAGAKAPHGILIKLANVFHTGSSRSGNDLDAKLQDTIPWLESAEEALTKARKSKKLILACVRASYRPQTKDPKERLLQALAFTDPELNSLIRANFIPLRMAVTPVLYTRQHGNSKSPRKKRDRRDPLAAIGADTSQLKPLALVVSTGKSKAIATLSSIGTFDPRPIKTLLLEALRLNGDTKIQAPRISKREAAAAKFYHAAVSAELAHKSAAANEQWRHLARRCPNTLWQLRARARKAWPAAMRAAETMPHEELLPAQGDLLTRRTEHQTDSTEQAQLTQRAIDYLLRNQESDGGFRTEVAMYRPAITAIVAKCVFLYSKRAQGTRAKHLLAASRKARHYLEQRIQQQDPKQESTFTSTYGLDFALALLADRNSDANRRFAEDMTDYLIAGQCPNGAFSYSYQFGTTWRGGFGGWPRTSKGRTHSMNTGPALVLLAKAKKLGVKVSQRTIDRASKELMKMRVAPGRYTYTWPVPRCFERGDQSIARGPVCEHALYLCGKVEAKALDAAVSRFLDLRKSLRLPVKLDSSWATPSNHSSYFYFYAYYHACDAISALDPENKGAALAALRSDMLATPELDSTWFDYIQLGKPYGTAMALMVLAASTQ